MKRTYLAVLWLFLSVLIAIEKPEIGLGLILGFFIYESWTYMPQSIAYEVDRLPENSELKKYLQLRTSYKKM